MEEESSASEMWNKMSWMKGRRVNRSIIAPDKIKELLLSPTPDLVGDKPPYLKDVLNSLLESEISVAELNNCVKRKDSAPDKNNPQCLALPG